MSQGAQVCLRSQEGVAVYSPWIGSGCRFSGIYNGSNENLEELCGTSHAKIPHVYRLATVQIYQASPRAYP